MIRKVDEAEYGVVGVVSDSATASREVTDSITRVFFPVSLMMGFERELLKKDPN